MAEHGFTPDEIAKFEKAFSILDKDGSGTVASKDIGTLIRAAGENPSEKEVMDLVEDPDAAITQQEFFSIMAKAMALAKDTEEEIIECFKVFDAEQKGLMGVAELKNVLCSLGEKMTDDEVNEMISGVKPDGDGKINYAELTKVLMSG